VDHAPLVDPRRGVVEALISRRNKDVSSNRREAAVPAALPGRAAGSLKILAEAPVF
jgi:hypothetical protein